MMQNIKVLVGDDGAKKLFITGIIYRMNRIYLHLKYYCVLFSAPDNPSSNMFSLTWTCKFPNDNDTYYFAHCYPYTYSDLQVNYVFEVFIFYMCLLFRII